MKLLTAFLCTVSWAAIGAQTGSLVGVVRDEQDAAVAGVQIIIERESSHVRSTTTSDAQGGYQFLLLPTGDYRLETAREGFVPGLPLAVSITEGAAATTDIELRRLSAERPRFEAAGVRGLIDPGGYSAPSNAAAASGLIKGVADIKRSDNDATLAMDSSCALEPRLKQEVERKPASAEASLKLGEFYLAHGQEAKALSVLEHARSLDSNDQKTLEQLAEAYLQAGRFDAAEQLLTLDKVHQGSQHYRLLARADEGTGSFAEASHAYQLAAERDSSEENFFGAGYELILAGLPGKAEQAFLGGIQNFPRSIKLLVGLGSTQFLEGRTAESIDTLLHAVDLDPADPRPYTFLSSAASAAPNDLKQVEAAFERFLSVAPDNPRASYYMAIEMLHQPVAFEVNGRSRVEDLLKRSVRLDPGQPDAHFQLGVLYARRQDYKAAAEELEKALHLSPNLEEAHYRLARAYRQTGHPDLSAKEMQRFRELQERSPAQKSGMGLDVDQFISVLGKPEDVAAHGIVCADNAP